jgi:V-type H+-transporting ATPase subunit a
MSIFRSAEMKYFHIHIPKEDTYDVVNRIAQYDFVQFMDAAPNNFHKPFFNSVKRCEEVIQKIDIILKNINKHKIHLP